MKQITVFLLLLLCLTFRLQAKSDQITFNHLKMTEGLSNCNITSFAQDNKGFIWIGTEYGLDRYNAYDLNIYYYLVNNKNSLSCSFISCLLNDSKGRLWIGTRDGLNLYN